MELYPTGRVEFRVHLLVAPDEPADSVIDVVLQYLRDNPGYVHETWKPDAVKHNGSVVEFGEEELPGPTDRKRLAPVLRQGFSCLGTTLDVRWAPQAKKPKYPVSAEEPTPGWVLRVRHCATGRSDNEVLAAFDEALQVVTWGCASFPLLEAKLFSDYLKRSSVGFSRGPGNSLGSTVEEAMIDDTFRDPRAFWSRWDHVIPIKEGRRFVSKRPILREPEDTLEVIHWGMELLRVTEHDRISHSSPQIRESAKDGVSALPRRLTAVTAEEGTKRFDLPAGAGRLTDADFLDVALAARDSNVVVVFGSEQDAWDDGGILRALGTRPGFPARVAVAVEVDGEPQLLDEDFGAEALRRIEVGTAPVEEDRPGALGPWTTDELMPSPDGEATWFDVTLDAGRWTATGSRSIISGTGRTWSVCGAPKRAKPTQVHACGGVVLVGQASGGVLVGADGNAFRGRRDGSTNESAAVLVLRNGRLIAFSEDSYRISISEDGGKSFERRTIGFPHATGVVETFGGNLYAVSPAEDDEGAPPELWASSDGGQWWKTAGGCPQSMIGLCADTRGLVMLSSRGVWGRSENTDARPLLTLADGDPSLRAIAVTQNAPWVAVGDGGAVWVSLDRGRVWSRHDVPEARDLASVAVDADQCLALSCDGRIFRCVPDE